jgi:tripartite-type tricarboxylate transporter receptor subunit TctC
MSRTVRAHLPAKPVAIIICAFFAAAPAWAQLTPFQPIRIIVGAPAGGVGDIAARVVARKLSEAASCGASSVGAGAASGQ